MEKRPPSPTRMLIAGGFAVSCFAILLFLWITFGGPVPLKPTSYRVTVPFKEATQLAVESDVRISGVSVGKVKAIELADAGSFANATIELEPRYAPLHADARATLRQKTLLGETYVELTRGSSGEPTVPEGGGLPAAQVAPSVQLDEIIRAFDEPTRAAFQTWMGDGAIALTGRGADLNAALGNLAPFASSADRVMRILDSQRLAVGELVRRGGETFEALSERRGALRGLIGDAERVFTTTAARDRELREALIALPRFLDEARRTLERLDGFSAESEPLVRRLRPAAVELSATLRQLGRLAPELEGFFDGLEPVIDRAPGGLGALRRLLGEQLPPPLERLDGYLGELIPIVQVVRAYRRELTATVANVAAASNGFNVPSEGGGRPVRYLRTVQPLGPGGLASTPGRLRGNRTNPYLRPGGYGGLADGLDSFLTSHCGGGLRGVLDPLDAELLPGDLFARIRRFAFGGALDTDDVPAPPCRQQDRFRSIGGAPRELTSYLRVRPQR